MVEKGTIFGRTPRSAHAVRRYSRAPLVIGIYEGQVDRLTKEVQEDFEQYVREGFAAAMLAGRTKQMRTVPVNARFVPDRLVGRYDDARRLIQEGAGPWATRNCVCRQGKDLLDEPCQQTSDRRVCLMIGGVARGSLASGEGQALTRAETLALLDHDRALRPAGHGQAHRAGAARPPDLSMPPGPAGPGGPALRAQGPASAAALAQARRAYSYRKASIGSSEAARQAG